MDRIRFRHLAAIFILMGVVSTALFVNVSSQKTELRGRAQSAGVQVQCSKNGAVQFAVSFTNPESVPVNLLIDVLIDTQTISRSYINVTPGQTRTDLISTNYTALPNTGDVVFTWFPENNPGDTNNTAASFDQIACDPTTPTPAPTKSMTDETDISILAVTPLPPQPETKPKPFYQAFFDQLTGGVQMLIFNFIRFLSAFT